jgi:hypothetical protein
VTLSRDTTAFVGIFAVPLQWPMIRIAPRAARS